MASYVKFKRGTPEAYLRAKESGRLEQDTLYFIFKEGELTADLYLGSRLISTGDSISSDLTELKLASLSDISINEPQAGDILTYNSETLKWENQSVDTLLDSYNPESTVVLVVENEYNNSHDTLIAEECLDFDEKSGDIIIIKDVISNDKYKYTGYIYNGSVWTAFTGNCDANNVYFQEDLIFTSAFGNYIPDTSGNVTVPAKGLSLQELLETAYSTEEKTNLIISNPTASVGGTLKYYEIGSTGSQDITISLGSDGEYKYGYDPNPASLKDGDLSTLIINDKTTGVAIDTSVSSPCILTVDGESIAPKESGGSIFTLSPSARTDRAELKVVGTIYHTQGYVPVSNLGKIYPTERIKAGNVSTTASARARWYIPMYQGFTYAESAIENPAEITSSQIESLNAPTASTVGAVKKVINEKAYNQTKITSATASRPWRQYFLAIPADYGWVMSSAKDANNIDCTIRKANDVTFVFEETEVVYNVYYINNAADYGTLTINWTL